MSQRSNEKLIDILERKFQLIKDTRKEEQNFAAMIDYHEYISSTESLTPIIHRLIENDRIAPVYLEQIFNDFLNSHYLKYEVKKVLPYPAFYTPEIEAKFKLMEKFIKFIGADVQRWKATGLVYIDADKPAINIDRTKIFFHAQRFHNDLIEKLRYDTAEETKDAQTAFINFDPEKSELNISGHIVKIRKFSDPYELLKVIFKDSKRIYDEWFYSEISEQFDMFAKLPAKKFSNAAYQLKQKIALGAGLTDVFTTTNQSIKLNNRYILKT